MTERKFTDEEVIKALEHCTSSTTSEACNGCPFYDTDVCIEMDNALNIYALDLINRQRAEIDDLTRDTIPKLKDGLERANKYGAELDKEFAELQQKYDLAVAEREANVKALVEKTAEVERLKQNNISTKYPNRVLCSKGVIFTKSLEDYDELIGDISAEAIKEFAERFENKLYCIPQHHFMLAQVLQDVKSLVIEMTVQSNDK